MFKKSSSQNLTLASVQEFRHQLLTYEKTFNRHQYQSAKQMMLELHNLASDIENMFQSFIIGEDNGNSKQILESGKSTLQSKNAFSKISYQNSNVPIKHKTNTHSNTYEKEQIQKIIMANKELEKQKKSILKILDQQESKVSQLQKQKKYCISLLNQNTVKDSDLEIENKFLRNENNNLNNILQQLQQENRNLIECDQEKSVLLKQIDYFLTNNGTKTGSKLALTSSRKNSQNQRLISQVVEYQQQLSKVTKQRDHLEDLQNNTQSELDQLTSEIQTYQQQNRQLRLKNQELINIQQSKKLNEIVHRQNKHLLQINYELGNKLYRYQQQIDKLILRVIELQGGSSTKRGAPTILSTSPSADRQYYFQENNNKPLLARTKSSAEIKHSSAQDTINKLNTKLKNQTDINSQLQDKIQQLLDQLYICEKSIFQKQRQIARFNSTLNLTCSQNAQTTQQIQIIDKDQNYDFANLQASETVEGQDILTLQQFVSKFEPSLMDTLFIMLRIVQIAVVMLEQGCLQIINPQQLLLQLDQPNKPQNIIVQLKSNQKQEQQNQQIHLYESPETLVGQQPTQASIVWNIGMVFYYLMNKEPYFKNINDIQNTGDVTIRQNNISQISELIKQTLRRDQDERITLDLLLQGISQEINKIFSQI